MQKTYRFIALNGDYIKMKGSSGLNFSYQLQTDKQVTKTSGGGFVITFHTTIETGQELKNMKEVFLA